MKKYFQFILLFLLLFPILCLAQAENQNDIIFKAEVIEIVDEQETELPDGEVVKQQNIKLKGYEGEYKNKEVLFEGIGSYDVIKKNIYEIGDKVLVLESLDYEGNSYYYITDYVRTSSIWWVLGFFVFVIIIVGKGKGIRSLISLFLTFLVIIKYIIPRIIEGANPITATIIGSLIILIFIIYITEGFKLKSHIAVFSIFISLVITVFLSWFFVNFAKLSGLVGEDVFSLINIGDHMINFEGLLLAGIIIGALGVLDDVVISQIATVEELKKANQNLNKRDLFSRAYKVGVSHISSMTNTLFLAYAGASLSLLIIFISGQSAYHSWFQIINNEQIATEIIRTLAGSIGLILSVPISTYIASIYFSKNIK